MYDYAVVTAVRPDNYHQTCREYEQQGYSLEQSSHYRTPPYVRDSLRGAETDARWDLIFRKASKDISYGQMLINRYGGKLREVSEKLQALVPHVIERSERDTAHELGKIQGDIDRFLFEGSPEDM